MPSAQRRLLKIFLDSILSGSFISIARDDTVPNITISATGIASGLPVARNTGVALVGGVATDVLLYDMNGALTSFLDNAYALYPRPVDIGGAQVGFIINSKSIDRFNITADFDATLEYIAVGTPP